MNERNEKVDPDILKGREDILRARKAAATGRQPGDDNYDKSSAQSRAASGPKKNPPRKVPREPSTMMKAVVDANRQKRVECGLSDVPVFDVTQKILTQQRQATSAKRTAPSKIRTAEPAEPVQIQTRTDQVDYKKPGYNSLVAAIVARDIDIFCSC